MTQNTAGPKLFFDTLRYLKRYHLEESGKGQSFAWMCIFADMGELIKMFFPECFTEEPNDPFCAGLGALLMNHSRMSDWFDGQTDELLLNEGISPSACEDGMEDLYGQYSSQSEELFFEVMDLVRAFFPDCTDG